MGAPKSLNPGELRTLEASTRDLPETDRAVTIRQDGKFVTDILMRENDVVHVTLQRMP